MIVTDNHDSTHEIAYAHGVEAWQMSERITGMRQLAIITVLRPFLDSPGRYIRDFRDFDRMRLIQYDRFRTVGR